VKNRLICLFLSVLVLIGLLPFSALHVSAASEMKTSDEAIEILKELEGFIPKPMYDNGQYSVGYGSGCNPNDYPNGITEEEADALLRDYLVNMERSVNSFCDRYQLRLSQNQFDALMLFTYNVGARWIYADGDFRQAVISGKRGNEFVYPFSLWSNASSKVQVHLVKRRLAEANMYLNGTYSVTPPSNYAYVLYNKAGGICDVQTQGYISDTPVTPKPIPVRTGYRFMGWYTEEEGGRWIRELSSETAGMTLHAHWQAGSGDPANGMASNYQLSTRNIASLNVYEAPGSTKVLRRLEVKSTVVITADYVDASGVKWGMLDDGGWVNLGNAIVGIVSTHSEETKAVTVTVSTDNVNLRSEPGSYSEKVAKANKGDQLEILEVRLVGRNKWGRCETGWISLMYTDYDQVLQDQIQEDMHVIATGVVANCNSLRIRSGAGAEYPVVGSMNQGAEVQILQKKTVNGTVWGKIPAGWVSMQYVKITSQEPEDETPEQTEPETEETKPETEDLSVTGSVIGTSALRIRSGAGTQYERIGCYNPGTKVTILASQTVSGELWGKTDQGWICLTYVKLDQPLTDQEQESTTASGKGTVNADGVRIRSAAGTNSRVLAYYFRGNRVEILEAASASGMQWGRTEKGWICLDYVTMDKGQTLPSEKPQETVPETKPDAAEPDEKPAVQSGKGTVNADGVRIRSAAGTNSRVLAYYFRGNRVEILETASASGMQWGRTEKGWICLDYVTMDKGHTVPEEKPQETEPEESQPQESKPAGPTVSESFWGTVNANGVRIRSGAGTGSRVEAYYFKGNRVQVLETADADGMRWGRTISGWFCLDYVDRDKVEQMPGSGSGQTSVTGTIVGCEALSVRSGAGTSYPRLDSYPKGTAVTIYEQTSVGGQKWGRTDMGWISLAYVQLGQTQPEAEKPAAPPETQPEGDTVFQPYKGTVNADGVRIRSAAGTDSRVVAYYLKGNRVEILETKEAGGKDWGRTIHGWVSLEFVDKDK